MSKILFEEDNLGETILEINWTSVLKNIHYFKEKLSPDTQLMLMVKANAYGNGAIGMATLIEKDQVANYLGVAYIDEGIELRKAGISLPIMVQNPSDHDWKVIVENCLEPEIHSLHLLKSFVAFIKKNEGLIDSNYPVHLKFNTGMNRVGIDEKEIKELLPILDQQKSLKLKSIMTHLSSSGIEKEDPYTNEQFNQFESIIEQIKGHADDTTIIHALNSQGVIRHSPYQYQMVRIGIGIYGSTSVEDPGQNLIPTSKLKTKVISKRRVKKGDSISYSRSGRAENDCNIAVLSIGYADGFPISLGNGNWKIEINGKLYPTIGVVCMDLCIVNLGNDHVDLGDDAIIFGGKKSIFEYATAMDTIPYEAMTRISKRARKIIVSN